MNRWQMSRWLWFSIALSALALAGVAALRLFFWDMLPERVPVHWDINFEPDGFVTRDASLTYFLLYPGVMVLIVILNLALPWLSPKHFKVDSFRRVFDYVMALVVLLFGYLLVVNLCALLSPGMQLSRLFVGGIFIFFAFLGNVLGQVQRNFWMGVRTPWTLASEAVWIGTHRQAAWLWTVMGIVGFVAVLAGVPMWICFTGLMIVALWPVVYSLILYKRLEKQGKV